MKKLFMSLLVLFVIYFGIQSLYFLFSKERNEEYSIVVGDNTFEIKEKATFENNNYYFEVTHNQRMIPFQVYNDFGHSVNVIKDIKYIKSKNNECFLPVFKDQKHFVDIMCLKGDDITYYHQIYGTDKELDELVSKIENYEFDNYKPKESEILSHGIIRVYKDNLQKDTSIIAKTYRGVLLVRSSRKVSDLVLFDKDIYNIELDAIVGNKYIVADYNSQHNFNTFIIVDITNGKTDSLSSNKKISFDSIIQGVVGNDMYLLDIDNEKQYRINIKTQTISEEGNHQTGVKYYNGKEWERISMVSAIKDKETFPTQETTETDNKEYSRIDKTGENDGYYYMYKKQGNDYDVYRSNIQSPDKKTFLFTTSDLDFIIYIKDYVYFRDDIYIKVYNDRFGTLTIFENKEMQFNSNLDYRIHY